MAKVIFSLERPEHGDQANLLLSRVMMDTVNNLGGKHYFGVYKGDHENSFELPFEHLGLVINWALTTEQESILIVDDNDQAELYYVFTKQRERLGKWQRVHQDQATSQDAYTYDPATGHYFIAA